MRFYLVFVFVAALLSADLQGQSNVLSGNVASFGMAGRTNLTMTLTIISPRNRKIGNSLISNDPITTQTDTNGNFSFSNVVFGYYGLTSSDSTGSRWPIMVFTDTTNDVQLVNLVNWAVATPPNNWSNYYNIPQINSLLESVASSTNTGVAGVTNAASTNAIEPIVISSTVFIPAQTNQVTAQNVFSAVPGLLTNSYTGEYSYLRIQSPTNDAFLSLGAGSQLVSDNIDLLSTGGRLTVSPYGISLGSGFSSVEILTNGTLSLADKHGAALVSDESGGWSITGPLAAVEPVALSGFQIAGSQISSPISITNLPPGSSANGRSLNIESGLYNWKLALQRTNAVRLMFVGDSTATLVNGSRAYGVKSFFSEFLPNVQKLFLSAESYPKSANVSFGGDDTNWFARYLQMPANSFATNDGYNTPLIGADNIKFAGISWPHGGTVNVYTISSTVSVPVLVASISLSNSIGSVGFITNIPVSGTYYTYVQSVTADAGYSNSVLFCIAEKSATKNLIVYDVGYGGQAVTDWVNVNTNIFYPVWAGLSNDVVIVAQKNSTGVMIETNMAALQTMFTNASPKSDMVWLSAFPAWAPGWDIDGINQQFYLNAQRTGQVFYDDGSQLPPTNTMFSMGLMTDGVHLTTLGGTLTGGLLARELKRVASGYDWTTKPTLSISGVSSLAGAVTANSQVSILGQSSSQNLILNNTGNDQTLIGYNVRGSGYNSWRVGAIAGTGNSTGAHPNYGWIPITPAGGYALGGTHLALELTTNGNAIFGGVATGNGSGLTNVTADYLSTSLTNWIVDQIAESINVSFYSSAVTNSTIGVSNCVIMTTVPAVLAQTNTYLLNGLANNYYLAAFTTNLVTGVTAGNATVHRFYSVAGGTFTDRPELYIVTTNGTLVELGVGAYTVKSSIVLTEEIASIVINISTNPPGGCYVGVRWLLASETGNPTVTAVSGDGYGSRIELNASEGSESLNEAKLNENNTFTGVNTFTQPIVGSGELITNVNVSALRFSIGTSNTVSVNTNAANGVNYGGTAFVSGTDTAGIITVITGSGTQPASPILCTNIFSSAFKQALSNATPVVIINYMQTVSSYYAGTINRAYLSRVTTNGFCISWVGGIMDTSSTNHFSYLVVRP